MGTKKSGAAARRKRASRLRKRIEDLRAPAADRDGPRQRPGESDLAYVERRMREIDRKARR